MRMISSKTVEEVAALKEIERLKQVVTDAQADRDHYVRMLWRCKGPEEFEALGFQIEWPFMDFSSPEEKEEYELRFKRGLPTRAPKLKVGDWSYDPLSKHNARIVRVSWDFFEHRWRYSIPGFSSYESYGPTPGAPNVEFVTDDGTCYRRADQAA